jgi:rhamnosyltransferase
MPLQRVAVIVPTLNAAKLWSRFNEGLRCQGLRPDQIWIVDSSSSDGTQDLVRAAGYHLLSIAREDFNHGSTRQWAAGQVGDAEILVYLTQDAVLTDCESIRNLVAAFADPAVGAAYGRQLPRIGAGVIEAHARTFNYPDRSVLRTLEYRKQAGFKAIFASNSYAAYRADALWEIGGFPSDVIVSEDTIVFARLLFHDWKTAYVANALVHHSHSYKWTDELRRYFDIGVLHSKEPWLMQEFGQVHGEGMRFVLSEIKTLWPRHFYLLPYALFRTLLKFCGYQMGRRVKYLSTLMARHLSQQKNYWV